MKVFFDTNVWIASLVAHGLCADLVGAALAASDAGTIEVLTCPAVLAEVQRLLRDKLHANEDQSFAARKLFQHINLVADGSVEMPPDFPDDWPILAAALAADADMFITGDKALLALGEIGGLPILDPRAAYLKLRGLD